MGGNGQTQEDVYRPLDVLQHVPVSFRFAPRHIDRIRAKDVFGHRIVFFSQHVRRANVQPGQRSDPIRERCFVPTFGMSGVGFFVSAGAAPRDQPSRIQTARMRLEKRSRLGSIMLPFFPNGPIFKPSIEHLLSAIALIVPLPDFSYCIGNYYSVDLGQSSRKSSAILRGCKAVVRKGRKTRQGPPN